MAAFSLLAVGALLAAVAVALSPDRRTAVLGLLCALASLSGLHLLLGAAGLGLAEGAGCLIGLGALLLRGRRAQWRRPRPAALAGLLGAALLGLLAAGLPGRGPAGPPALVLVVVLVLGAAGVAAALSPGRLRPLIGAELLLGAAALHCLALLRHLEAGRPEATRPLVTLFLSLLIGGQLVVGALLVSLLRGRLSPPRGDELPQVR